MRNKLCDQYKTEREEICKKLIDIYRGGFSGCRIKIVEVETEINNEDE